VYQVRRVGADPVSVLAYRPGTLGESWDHDERDRRRHWLQRQRRRGNVAATLEDCPPRQDHPRAARGPLTWDPGLRVAQAIEAAIGR